MTREEIVEAVANDKLMPFIQPEQLNRIVDFVVENYKPELPANLDEAAVDYANGFAKDGISHELYKMTFIAGAKWMAGQGVTLKVTDDTTWGEVNDFIHRNCDGVKEIQIRKKEESK